MALRLGYGGSQLPVDYAVWRLPVE